MQADYVTGQSTFPVSEESVQAAIQAGFRAAQAALLVRLRSIDWAEDAMQEAVLKALQRWPNDGIPEQPVAWLITAGTNHFRDHYRRHAKFDSVTDSLVLAEAAQVAATSQPTDAGSDEDVLRLIFMCCHPSIAVENQLALSLRMLMGFSHAEIAKALLISSNTLEQRLGRAKRKIIKSGISLELPRTESLPMRLDSVRQILYLLFNEGYQSVGQELINNELCRQAILLTRALCRGFPEPENLGLLSLMLFHDARATARVDASGELITLDAQDRRLWKRAQIHEADVLLQKVLRKGVVGRYQLQAAIAGLHSLAGSAQETDWIQIVGLYRRLLSEQPGPVVRLNYAVALMMAEQVADAEKILSSLQQELQDYSPYFAALARLCELTGRVKEAANALEKAAAATASMREQRHYQLQIDAIYRRS